MNSVPEFLENNASGAIMYDLHNVSSLNNLRCLALASHFVLLCLLNAADQIHAGECSCACDSITPTPPHPVSQLPSPVNLKQTHGIPREWPASEITDRCTGRKGTPSVVWLRAPAQRQLWLQLGDCSVKWRQRGPPAARWKIHSMRRTNVIWQASDCLFTHWIEAWPGRAFGHC